MFNCIRFKKLLAFQEEDRSQKNAFFQGHDNSLLNF